MNVDMNRFWLLIVVLFNISLHLVYAAKSDNSINEHDSLIEEAVDQENSENETLFNELDIDKKLITLLETPNVVKKIGYLLADGMGHGMSSYGHAYFRLSFSNRKNHWSRENDIVVSFSAYTGKDKYKDMANIQLLKGIGFSFGNYDYSYPSVITLSKYTDIMEEKNKLESRDLKTNQLKLTQTQIDNIIKEVIEIYTNKKLLKRYRFFTNNCAVLAMEVLSHSTQWDISTFLNIDPKKPNMVPVLLESNGYLVDGNKEIVDKGANFYRNKSINYNVDAKLFITNNTQNREFDNVLMAQNLSKQILSEKLEERILGQLKYKYLMDNTSGLSSSEQSSFAFNAKQLALQEPVLQSKKIFKILNDTNKFKFIPLKEDFFKLDEGNSFPLAELDSISLIVRDGIVHYHVVLNDGGKKTRTKDYPSKEFSYDKDRDAIVHTSSGITLFRTTRYINKKQVWGPGVQLFHEKVSSYNSTFVLNYLISEDLGLYPDSIENYSKDKITEKDTIYLTNRDIAKKYVVGSAGACYAMVVLQNSFLKRAYFLPQMKKLSEKENLMLVQALLEDRFVFIPGYEDVKSFTKSLNQTALSHMLLNHNAQISSRLDTILDTQIAGEAVDASNIQVLQNIVKHDLHIIISVKSNAHFVGHMFLLTDIKEEQGRYRFVMYDPNSGKGVGGQYIVDMDSYTLYHAENWPFDTQMIPKNVNLDYDLISLQLKKQLSMDLAAKIIEDKKYTFRLSELNMIFEELN